MTLDLNGVFGTLQLNGSLNDPICFINLPSLPPPGTIMAMEGPPNAYYRVIQAMLIVKPITDLSLAAIAEKVEASGEKYDFMSNQCVIFVEPFDPNPIQG